MPYKCHQLQALSTKKATSVDTRLDAVNVNMRTEEAKNKKRHASVGHVLLLISSEGAFAGKTKKFNEEDHLKVCGAHV